MRNVALFIRAEVDGKDVGYPTEPIATFDVNSSAEMNAHCAEALRLLADRFEEGDE